MKLNNKIYIIGSGAIGKALAVFLQSEKRNVQLVRGRVDNEQAHFEKITVVYNQAETLEEQISVTTLSNLLEIDGIVLVTTKSFSNDTIAKKLKEKRGDFPIIIMQNGLNIERPFEHLELKNIYRCVLFTTSQISKNGDVMFKSVAPSAIGSLQGENDEAEGLVQQINTQRFQFRSEENILNLIWEKAIINCAFNSICPLLEIDNGIFYRNAMALNLAEVIVRECLDVAKEYQIALVEKTIFEKLLLISKRAEGQLISTYEDIRNGRKTEIDSLNLEMARLAEKVGKPELVRVTKFLGEMIAIKSNR
jgi:2-dehydropantoate 2-reductase